MSPGCFLTFRRCPEDFARSFQRNLFSKKDYEKGAQSEFQEEAYVYLCAAPVACVRGVR